MARTDRCCHPERQPVGLTDKELTITLLEHGGRLRLAAQRYDIPLGDWLDLSTGINPDGYPVPAIPPAAWLRLPETDDGLEQAAADYYGSTELLPVAGSQPAIQALPALLPGTRIGVLTPTYAEHPHAWRERQVRAHANADALEAALDDTDVVVLVNPNNPSGETVEAARLRDWHARLQRRGGWLVVDEAFMDTQPGAGLVADAGRDGLVVLRSLGKFFGLAGARVGFVFAPASLRRRLAEQLGPWTLSGPARHVARIALQDRAWQTAARRRLAQADARLASLIGASPLGPARGPALFKWVITPRADAVFDHFARRGILLRRFDTPPSLRFGLPADETGWQRLADALTTLELLKDNP